MSILKEVDLSSQQSLLTKKDVLKEETNTEYSQTFPLIQAYKKNFNLFQIALEDYDNTNDVVKLLFFVSVSRLQIAYIVCLLNFGIDPNLQVENDLINLTKKLGFLIRFENGDTALHVLFRKRSFSTQDCVITQNIAEKLLQNRANPNIRNAEKLAPLHILAINQSHNMMRWAIKFNMENKVFNFDKKGGFSKWTIAHYSALHGSVKIINEISKINLNVLQRNTNNQLAKSLCFSSVHIIKILRKLENQYLFSSLQKQSKKPRYLQYDIKNKILKRSLDFEQSRCVDSDELLSNSEENTINDELADSNSSAYASRIKKSLITEKDQDIFKSIFQITQTFAHDINQNEFQKFLNLLREDIPQQSLLSIISLLHMINFKLRYNVIFKSTILPTPVININQLSQIKLQMNLSILQQQKQFWDSLVIEFKGICKKYQEISQFVCSKYTNDLVLDPNQEESLKTFQRMQNISKNLRSDLTHYWNSDVSLDNEYKQIHNILTTINFTKINSIQSNRMNIIGYESLQNQSLSRIKKIDAPKISLKQSNNFSSLQHVLGRSTHNHMVQSLCMDQQSQMDSYFLKDSLSQIDQRLFTLPRYINKSIAHKIKPNQSLIIQPDFQSELESEVNF